MSSLGRDNVQTTILIFSKFRERLNQYEFKLANRFPPWYSTDIPSVWCSVSQNGRSSHFENKNDKSLWIDGRRAKSIVWRLRVVISFLFYEYIDSMMVWKFEIWTFWIKFIFVVMLWVATWMIKQIVTYDTILWTSCDSRMVLFWFSRNGKVKNRFALVYHSIPTAIWGHALPSYKYFAWMLLFCNICFLLLLLCYLTCFEIFQIRGTIRHPLKYTQRIPFVTHTTKKPKLKSNFKI